MNGGTKIKLQFSTQILLTLVTVGLLLSYPVFVLASGEVVKGIVAGAGLSLLNVLMGYAAIEYSFDKSHTRFLQVVFGGMGIRLLVMMGLVLLLLTVFKFHVVALVGSLFGMYIIFLGLEVLYIHNKWQDKIR